jgi:hypothetical protein
VNTVMNLVGSVKYWEDLSSCTTFGFSRRAQLHGVHICVHIYRLLFYVLVTVSKSKFEDPTLIDLSHLTKTHSRRNSIIGEKGGVT